VSSEPIDRARGLWAELGGARFPVEGAEVVVRPDSGLCPPGWCGVVTLGQGALLTAPTEPTAELLRGAVAHLVSAEPVDLAGWASRLPVADVIGPARLAYLDPAEFRPGPAQGVRLAADHPALTALRARATPDEAAETDLDDLDFAALAPDGQALAAAGYARWRDRAAHFNVFADPAHRGRGHARAAASAAVGHALAAGLLPQWRARPEASRRLAGALGFRELGVQFCVRLD
jgi:RimJ/RimL family protein N-acetyltransferase